MPKTLFFQDLVNSFPSMEGTHIAITGCTSGTGFVLAKTCAQLGATVYMVNRDSQRAASAQQEVQKLASAPVVHIECDLQNFESVRRAGERLRSELQHKGLDVLCNNAGVMGMPDMATIDGFDVQIQTNHLSHFLLTSELWPLLVTAAQKRGEARVVNHSSGARKMGKTSIISRYFERNGGNLGGDGFPGMDKWKRYQQSKLANLLFSYALHDRRPEGASQNIKVLTAHPGPTDSGLQKKTVNSGGTRLLDRYIIKRTLRVAQSVEDGTAGIARCSCEPGLNSAEFYGPAGSGLPGKAVLLEPERDVPDEQLLWEVSLKSCGIDNFFGQ